MKRYKKTIPIDFVTTADVLLEDVFENIHTEDLVEELLSRSDVNVEDRIKLSKKFTAFETDGLHSSSLYDQMKIDILRQAYSKYNLNQLEEKLK